MRNNSTLSRSRVNASRAPNGSSINSKLGWLIKVRARTTRCRIPPESCFGYASSKPLNPTRANSSRAVAASDSAVAPCCTSSGNRTFCKTVRQGIRFVVWKTKPISACGSIIFRPCHQTLPASGACNPAIMRSRVLFPLPLGPNKQINSPAATAKLTACRACTGAAPPAKNLLIFSTTKRELNGGWRAVSVVFVMIIR